MSVPLNIPKLGVSMTEGTLVEWLVADGDAVQAGDVKVGTVYSGGGVTASMVAPLSFQLLRPYVRKGSTRLARA